MRITLFSLCLLCACFLCACGTGLLEKENIDIARSYRTLYRAAEKGDAMSVHLEQETIEAIVDSLAEDGHVAASISSTMGIRLAGQVELFCDGVLDSLTLLVVCPDGGFIRYDLTGSGMCTVSRVYWDGSKPVQSYARDFTAPDFALTDGGYFTFQAPDERVFLRLNAQDEALAQFAAKYVEPVGYSNINLFTADWDVSDLSGVDLNALFPVFFGLEEISPLTESFPVSADGMTAYVPSHEFEGLICSYLGISSDAVREIAEFDTQEHAYPVHIVSDYDRLMFSEAPYGEVRSADENADGSLTLEVHAVYSSLGMDSAFVHELTVMPEADGNFSYVSNRVLHTPGEVIPEYIDLLELTGAA